MTTREKELLEKVKSYNLLEQDVTNLEERLRVAEYKVTPTLKQDGGGFGGFGKNSKVENLALRRVGLERELDKKKRWLCAIDDAFLNAGLNRREKELIRHTMNGESLSSYAKQKNIYKSHVYKIRDGAIRKMRKRIEAQNVLYDTVKP